jgi:hypothetical protein
MATTREKSLRGTSAVDDPTASPIPTLASAPMTDASSTVAGNETRRPLPAFCRPRPTRLAAAAIATTIIVASIGETRLSSPTAL